MDSDRPKRWPVAAFVVLVIAAAGFAVSMDKVPDPAPDESVRPTAEQEAEFVDRAQNYYCGTVEPPLSDAALRTCMHEPFTEARQAASCERLKKKDELRDACLAAPAVWTDAFVAYASLTSEWRYLCRSFPAKNVAEFLRVSYVEHGLNDRIEVGLEVPDGLPTQLPPQTRWDGVHDKRPCERSTSGT